MSIPCAWTSPKVPTYLENWNTALLQMFDLTVHDLDKFFNEVELVIDLDFIQRFKLTVITKAPTLRGLVRSFLLRASAATFAFTRMYCRVSSSSSNELSVVGSRKLSPSPSASL
ncbi:hypothetical protein Tco_1319196 [Tanacetum coccineum]